MTINEQLNELRALVEALSTISPTSDNEFDFIGSADIVERAADTIEDLASTCCFDEVSCLCWGGPVYDEHGNRREAQQ